MMDKARDDADQARSAADTERTVADHDRIRGDHNRADANTKAIVDLTATIAELSGLLVIMAQSQADNAAGMQASFGRLRWLVRIAAVGVFVLVFGVLRLNGIADSNKRYGRILVDCTTPTATTTPGGPPAKVHACYERGVAATTIAITDLRRSIDCAAFYIAGQRPPACVAVDERMDVILDGGDPFAPTTSTTRP